MSFKQQFKIVVCSIGEGHPRDIVAEILDIHGNYLSIIL